MNKRFWSTLMVGGFLFSLGLGGCADKSSPSVAAPRDLTTVTERDLAADPALTGTVGTTYLFTLEAFEPEHDENDPGLNGEVDVATWGMDSAALSLPETNLRICVEPGPEGHVFDLVMRSPFGDEVIRTKEDESCVYVSQSSAGRYQLEISRIDDTPALPVFIQVTPVENSNPPSIEVTAYHGSCAGCNLAGIALPGYALKGSMLSRANLTGADLSGANLIEADLSEAILIDANLRGAKLYHANLHHSILDGTDVTDASFANDRVMGIGPVFSAISAGISAYKFYRETLEPSPSDILAAVKEQGAKLQNSIEDLQKSINNNQQNLINSLKVLRVDIAKAEEDLKKFLTNMRLSDIEDAVDTADNHLTGLDQDPIHSEYIKGADFPKLLRNLKTLVFYNINNPTLFEMYTNEIIFNHRLKYAVAEKDGDSCPLPCTWRTRLNNEAIKGAQESWKFMQSIFMRYVFLQLRMDMIQREYLKRLSNPEVEISTYEKGFNKDVIQKQCDIFAKRVETMVLNLIDWHDMTTSGGVIPDWAQDIFQELDLTVAAVTGKNPYHVRGRTISLSIMPYEQEVSVSVPDSDQPQDPIVAHRYGLSDSADALYTEAVHEIPFYTPEFGIFQAQDIYLDQWVMINKEFLVRADSKFVVTHLVAAADQLGREAKIIRVRTHKDGFAYQNTMLRPITYYKPRDIQTAEPSEEDTVPYANFTLTNYLGTPYAIFAQEEYPWLHSNSKSTDSLDGYMWKPKWVWDKSGSFNDQVPGECNQSMYYRKSSPWKLKLVIENLKGGCWPHAVIIWFPIKVAYETPAPKIRQDWNIYLSSPDWKYADARLDLGHFVYEKPRDFPAIRIDQTYETPKYYDTKKSFFYKSSKDNFTSNRNGLKEYKGVIHHSLQTEKYYPPSDVIIWQDSQGQTHQTQYFTVYIMARFDGQGGNDRFKPSGFINLLDVWLEW